MAIEVLEPGLLTTIQDLGRYGFQRYGIPPAGAVDSYALRIGNLLLGNEEGEAGLEVTLIGPTLRFEEDCWIAITGADLGARINDMDAPLWETIPVTRGDILSFAAERPKKGMRAYITVAGGIDIPPILGSKSTYLRATLGGVEGRALRQGDRLNIKPRESHHRRLPHEYIPQYKLKSIRVILGPNEDHFTSEGIRTFFSSEYQVLPESDRMALRLKGPKIEHKKGADIISEPVCTGAIQVPGNGQPIVLLTDRQTTGGYAKIGVVISADLPRLAQAQPGDMVSFEECSLEMAYQLLHDVEKRISQIKEQIKRGLFDCRERKCIRTPSRVYNIEIVKKKANTFAVSVAGTLYNVTVLTQKPQLIALPSEKDKFYTLTAPMPGEISEVFVSCGDKIKKGDKLLVLEALKMEHTLLSPVEGTIAEISIEKGMRVETGQMLMTIIIETLNKE